MERGGGLCKHGSTLMLLIGWKWSVSMLFSSHSLFLSVSFSSQSFPKVAHPYSPALCRSIIQAPTSINRTTKTYSSWITHKKKQPCSWLDVLFSIQHDGTWELKGWRCGTSAFSNSKQLFYSASQHHASQFGFRNMSWALFSGRVLYHYLMSNLHSLSSSLSFPTHSVFFFLFILCITFCHIELQSV